MNRFSEIDIQQVTGERLPAHVKTFTDEEQVYNLWSFRNDIVYEPNKRNVFGLAVNLQSYKFLTDDATLMSYCDSTQCFEYSQSSNCIYSNKSLFGNIFYNYIGDEFNLLLNADFNTGSESNDAISVTSNHTIEPFVSSVTNNSNLVYYLQAAATYNILENLNLSFGADFSQTSVLQAYDVSENLPSLSSFDIATYQQRYAGYASLNYAYSLFHYSVGVRHEAVSLKRSDELNVKAKEFFGRAKFYPTASVSMTKNAFQSQLSYSMLTDYPSYNSLRAGVNYGSPYLYEGGNPNLVPEIQYVLSFLGRYKKTSLMVDFSTVYDDIMSIPTLLNNDIIYYNYFNLGPNKYLSVSLGQRLNWSEKAESFLSANYRAQWLGIPGFTNERGDRFTLRINNTIQILEKLKLAVNGSYRSMASTGINVIPQSWNMDIKLYMNFFDNQLNVYFAYDDIFSTLHEKKSFDYNLIVYNYDRVTQTRTFSINVTYRLANLVSGKSYKGHSSNDEVNRL